MLQSFDNDAACKTTAETVGGITDTQWPLRYCEVLRILGEWILILRYTVDTWVVLVDFDAEVLRKPEFRVHCPVGRRGLFVLDGPQDRVF